MKIKLQNKDTKIIIINTKTKFPGLKYTKQLKEL